MQSLEVGTTVILGNHHLTPAEVAAGTPPRKAFVDQNGDPVDPDTVRIFTLAPTGEQRSYSWPTTQTGDAGPVQREEVGRFYVASLPAVGEDGLWRWFLGAATTSAGGQTGQSDQKVFYVQRPIVR